MYGPCDLKYTVAAVDVACVIYYGTGVVGWDVGVLTPRGKRAGPLSTVSGKTGRVEWFGFQSPIFLVGPRLVNEPGLAFLITLLVHCDHLPHLVDPRCTFVVLWRHYLTC